MAPALFWDRAWWGLEDVMERPRVLLVDRDAEVRGALSRMLEGHGYTVHAVESRLEGFDLLDELGPDLLILDDPGEERAYRLVWLKETDQPDTRVELLALEPDVLTEQLEGVLGARRCA